MDSSISVAANQKDAFFNTKFETSLEKVENVSNQNTIYMVRHEF